MIPQQHAIERARRRDQLLAAFRKDHPIDQCVDRRILDADIVLRARRIGRLRAPMVALLVARRKRFPPGRHDSVEVHLPEPVFVLRVVDGANRYAHPEPFQRGAIKQCDALEIGLG